MMLELDLDATADNPPEIHTVAKNYIDLAYRASTGCGKLLIDDRQVRYLSVRYSLKMVTAPSIFVRATRMSAFREDIRLARNIRRESDRSSWREDDRMDENLEDLRHWERDREHIVSRYGEQTFHAHRRFQLTRVQQGRLAGTERLLHSILLDLLSGALSLPVEELEFGGVRLAPVDLSDIQKQFLFSPSISLDLAPLPQRRGEGANFKRAVEAALAQLRATNPRLFPLFTELAVAILLVPPLVPLSDGAIDLDNLARKIVPRVHTVLEPPSRKHIPDPNTIRDARLRTFFQEQAQIAKRLPKHHITRYEVIELPRTSSDPPAGSVRLVLCDGSEGRAFADFVSDTIDKWDDERR
ncbi:hypothetical protein WME75_38400 [Sorangium sp. So ce1014]|uniref:hypothetical protein n=1 Tax=Sorangium sp. So ce1014 TaxID=3133326 RepID=UPI003F60D739